MGAGSALRRPLAAVGGREVGGCDRCLAFAGSGGPVLQVQWRLKLAGSCVETRKCGGMRTRHHSLLLAVHLAPELLQQGEERGREVWGRCPSTCQVVRRAPKHHATAPRLCAPDSRADPCRCRCLSLCARAGDAHYVCDVAVGHVQAAALVGAAVEGSRHGGGAAGRQGEGSWVCVWGEQACASLRLPRCAHHPRMTLGRCHARAALPLWPPCWYGHAWHRAPHPPTHPPAHPPKCRQLREHLFLNVCPGHCRQRGARAGNTRRKRRRN